MDIWQTASPAEPVSTGWIGRWLDATGDDPLRAVNIGPVLPPLAVGEKYTAAALSPNQAQAERADRFDTIMGALGTDDPTDTPAMAAVCKAYRAARTTDARFASVKSTANEHNSLATQLSMVANAVKARVPTRVYTVQLGGFDTHANERETQQRLLQTLDEAVTPFLQQMAGDPYGKNVVLMTYSEFGRRVRANASQGTDHGTAGPVFVAGAPGQGRLLRRRTQPEEPRQRRPEVHHRLSRRLLRVAVAHRRDRPHTVGRHGPNRPGLPIGSPAR